MKWVTMWGNAMQTVLPHPATYAKDVTLRYPIFVPFDGTKIKITLDNFCCDEDVTISNVCVAIGRKLTDEQNTKPIHVSFNGSNGVVIKAHQHIVSDVVDIKLNKDEFLIVSLYLKEYTNLTSGVDIIGPLSKGYFAYKNQLENPKLDINTSKATSWVYFLSNVDIYTDENNEAIICFGDSITSQDWPDYFELSLRDMGIYNVSVIRKAVSGTRILRQYDCITYQSYGLKGENRFLHEVSMVKGCKKIIIQHGINDIIHPVGIEKNIFRPMSDLPTSIELENGLNYYLEESKKLGLKPYLGTLLPIYGWRTYEQFREELKNEVNDFIRQHEHIDFEKEVGEYFDNCWHFKENCDSGDHLHPSKYAYSLMGKLATKIIK